MPNATYNKDWKLVGIDDTMTWWYKDVTNSIGSGSFYFRIKMDYKSGMMRSKGMVILKTEAIVEARCATLEFRFKADQHYDTGGDILPSLNGILKGSSPVLEKSDPQSMMGNTITKACIEKNSKI